MVRPSAHLGSSMAVGKLVVLPTTFAVGPGWFKRGVVNDGVVGIGTAPDPDGGRSTLPGPGRAQEVRVTGVTAGISGPPASGWAHP